MPGEALMAVWSCKHRELAASRVHMAVMRMGMGFADLTQMDPGPRVITSPE